VCWLVRWLLLLRFEFGLWDGQPFTGSKGAHKVATIRFSWIETDHWSWKRGAMKEAIGSILSKTTEGPLQNHIRNLGLGLVMGYHLLTITGHQHLDRQTHITLCLI
jgi:hypothetical protein